MTLIEMIQLHEGLRLKPYRCTEGYLTIGYGRNLDTVGVSETEAEVMLMNDIYAATTDLAKLFPGWQSFPQEKRDALVDMRFNLGPSRFRMFRRMIAAVQAKDWSTAAAEAKDSKWYGQVGDRSKRIVGMLSV